MFFLLYTSRHNDDGVFDDFWKICDHFPKISKDSTKFVCGSQERFRAFPKISEDYRRFPRIAKDSVRGRPKDVLIIHQRIKVQFKRQLNLISAKSSISSLVRIWKLGHSSPGRGFV